MFFGRNSNYHYIFYAFLSERVELAWLAKAKNGIHAYNQKSEVAGGTKSKYDKCGKIIKGARRKLIQSNIRRNSILNVIFIVTDV